MAGTGKRVLALLLTLSLLFGLVPAWAADAEQEGASAQQSEQTQEATEAPTEAPTQPPTQAPTQPPTAAPTEVPTQAPPAPTEPPTEAKPAPTEAPTQAKPAPTEAKSDPTEPKREPTEAKSAPTEGKSAPTEAPTRQEVTEQAAQRPAQENTVPVSYTAYEMRGGKPAAAKQTAKAERLKKNPGALNGGAGAFYYVEGKLSADKPVTVTGTVHLILKDGAEFHAAKGIQIASGAALHLYVETDKGTGALTAGGGSGSAGIGVDAKGALYIHGGAVTATGGKHGAGIGGGKDGDCGTVTIYNGAVTATGGEHGAGIGGGKDGSGGTVTIYNGTVTAAGAQNAMAIGHGTGEVLKGGLTLGEQVDLWAGENEADAALLSAGRYLAAGGAYLKAEPHRTHNSFTYAVSKDGKTLTAQCGVCGETVSLSISAKSETYTGKPYAGVTLEGLSAFNAATGLDLDSADVTYSGSGTASGLLAPGSYKARLSVGGKRIEDDFTIRKVSVTGTWTAESAPVDAEHPFAFAVDGGEKRVTCTVQPVPGLTAADQSPLEDFTVTIAGGKASAAGSYTASAAFRSERTGRYVELANAEQPWAIVRTALEVTGYEGTYDGARHSITVTVPSLWTGAKVYYSDSPIQSPENLTDGMRTNPAFRDAGTHRVYYCITGGPDGAVLGSETVRISPKALTVTAEDKTITYGDAPADAGVAFDGFADGEDVRDLSGALDFQFDYRQFDDVGGGSFSITPTGLRSGNYDITFVPGTLTVRPLEAKLAWTAGELTYDGTAQSVTASVGNAVNGDEVTVTCEDNVHTEAGSYTAAATGLTGAKGANYVLPAQRTYGWRIGKGTNEVSVSLDGWTYGDPAAQPQVSAKWGAPRLTYGKSADSAADTEVPTAAGSYVVKATVSGGDSYDAATATAAFTISPRAITVTPADQSSPCGADLLPLTFDVTQGALVGGDTLDALGISAQTTATDSSAAGAYPITLSGGAGNANYAVTLGSGTYTLTRAQAAVKVTAYSGTYDGQPHGITVEVKDTGGSLLTDLLGTLFGTRREAVVWYSTVQPLTAENCTQGSTEAPTARDVTAEPVTVYYYVDLSGYTDGGAEGISGVSSIQIKPREVTLNWENTSFTYDGTPHQPTAEAGNLVRGEQCGVNVDGAQTEANLLDETYIATATSLESANYALPQNRSAPFSITPLRNGSGITCTLEHNTFVYNGQPQGPAAADVVVKDGDTPLTPEQDYTVTVEQKTDVGGYTLTVSLQGNYEGTETVNWSITQATANTVQVSLQGWTYGETPNTPSAAGSSFGAETAQFSYAQTQDGTYGSEVIATAGTHYVKAVVPETTNYAGGEAVTAYTVAARAITVKPADVSGVYGGAQADITSLELVEGTLAEGDTLAGLNASCAVDGLSENAPVGDYVISITSTDNTNYDIATQTGTYTVTAKPVTLEWSDTELTYNGEEQAPTATVRQEDVLGGDNTPTVTGVSGGQTDANTAQTPTYTATATGLSDDNYTLPEDPTVEFTIAPLTLTLEWPENPVYNGAEQTMAPTPGNLARASDKVNFTCEDDAFATDHKTDGSYQVTAVRVDNPNYVLPEPAECTHEWNIEPAENTVKVSLAGWTYGDAPNAPSAAGSSFGAETAQFTYADSAGGTYGEVVPTAVGSHWVKAVIPATDNYTGGEAVSSFSIGKKTVTVTADDQSTPTGTAPAKLTISYGEMAYGEDPATLGVTASCDVTAASKPGTYAINLNAPAEENPNYILDLRPGSYTVTKQGGKVTAKGADVVYDGLPHGIKVTVTDKDGKALSKTEAAVYYADKPLDETSFEGGSAASPTYTDAGKYTVYYYVAYGESYGGKSVTGSKTVNISKRPLTITAKDQTVRDGGKVDMGLTAVEAEGLLVNLKERVWHTVSAVNIDVSSKDDSGKSVKEGTIRPSKAKILDGYQKRDVSANYDITYADGKLTMVSKGEFKVWVDVPKTGATFNVTLGEEQARSLLTAAELERWQNGANVKVHMEIVELKASEVPSADKSTLDKAMENSGGKVEEYLSITLWKQIGGDKAIQITDTNGLRISMTVTVPDAMKGASGTTRTFYLLRIHNGAAEMLSIGTATTFTAASSKFSTYAIGVKDKTSGSGSGGSSGAKKSDSKTSNKTANRTSGSTAANKTSGKSTVNPKTGDEGRLALWVTLAGGAGVVLLALAFTGRKKRKK